MADGLDELRRRRGILRAYVMVLERASDLFTVCAAATGGATATRLAVENEFGLDSVEAEAVLNLQVRRFAPDQAERIRQELADVERQTEAAERAQADAASRGRFPDE